jgi:hypothetical protein
MAILDLQRREMESGRIRFGNKVGNRPNRLDHPLLTSPDSGLLMMVEKDYYGSDSARVTPWPGGEGQWQLEITADLNILIPVSPEPCSQYWERWSGGGCMRRCDGITDQINDAPCDCDKTADKRACSATTRITVLLPETGDARWRIETKSLYAAIELPASLERAQGEKTGEVIPGVLSVEQRPGKKGKVPVPVIRLSKPEKTSKLSAMSELAYGFDKSAGDSAPAEQPEGVAPSGGRVESPESDGGSGSGDSPATRSVDGAAVAQEDERRQRDTAEVAGSSPASGPSPAISEAQRRRLMAKAREHNVSTEDAKELIKDLAGVESSKDIPAAVYETVIYAIEHWDAQAQLVRPERQEDVG